MALQDQIKNTLTFASFFPLSETDIQKKANALKEGSRKLFYDTNQIWVPLQKFVSEISRFQNDDLSPFIDMLPLSDLEDFQEFTNSINTSLSDLKGRIESANNGTQVNIAPPLAELQTSLVKALPRVSHYVRFLCSQKDSAQVAKIASNFQSLPEAISQLNFKIKETQEVAKALEEKAAKVAQYEMADGQIIEITKCIERHKAMSNNCLIALVVAILIAGRLLIWISADQDKLFFCVGPAFKSLATDTTSGVAFYGHSNISV